LTDEQPFTLLPTTITTDRSSSIDYSTEPVSKYHNVRLVTISIEYLMLFSI
jgi:hypothetical protein